MVNQALFDVVKNQLASGVSEAEVREFLRRRGTDEIEVRELFDELAAQGVAIREIPIDSEPAHAETFAAPAVSDVVELAVTPEQDQVHASVVEPLAAPVTNSQEPSTVPAQSEAHGIVRDIPPLQPSAPFAPASPEQVAAIQAIVPPAGVVFEEQDAEAVRPGKKRIVAMIGGGILALAIFFFGGYFVYSTYFASPDRVLDAMFLQLRDVRSAEMTTDAFITTDGPDASTLNASSTNPFLRSLAPIGTVQIAVHASGTIDLSDVQNPQIALAISSTMDKWAMGDFLAGFEYRNIGRSNYLKFTDVPDLGFLKLDFLKNQWFSISDRDAKAQLGAVPSSDGHDTLITPPTQEERDRVISAWKQDRFLAVANVLDTDTTIDGMSMHHYALAFDKDAFVRWSGRVGGTSFTASTSDALSTLLDSTDINQLEVWIGKRDGLPHKVVAHVTLHSAADPSRISEVVITMSGSKFNQALPVVVPEEVKSFDELLRGVFEQMLGENTGKIPVTLDDRNEQRRSDVAAIADAIRANIANNNGTFACAAGPLPSVATFMGVSRLKASGYMIEPCLVPQYMWRMPRDPSKGTSLTSGYSVLYNGVTKKVTVRAPYTEGGKAMITVTR